MVVLHPTDIRQYLYCPRIIYFTYVQPVRKLPTLKMRAGAEVHQLEAKAVARGRRSQRELPKGIVRNNVSLYSRSLGLSGKLDRLIICPDGKLAPVELKPSPILETRHQYQLVAYAMMVEEEYKGQVEEAYIYSLSTRQVLPVTVSTEKKKYVKDCLSRIRRIIQSEHFPPATAGRRGAKCRDCEYRRYCGGVY
ncbi:MAG: CRISPR-associated protein Cas4 [Firmicutes bacterium]|nr:CRISPR-associated protein Cas4 [Bacillota bacterium]